MGWLKELRERRPVLGEIVKQLIDQPLHILMTLGSVLGAAGVLHFGSAALVSTLGVAWSAVGGVLVTVIWNVAREADQWPSKRWWDPPMDWFFEALGTGLGAWAWIVIHAKYLALAPASY